MTDQVKNLRKLLSIPAQRIMGTVTHVATEEHVAALTFDDGPHPEYTPRLLDILEKYHAHGTFFMIGEAASKFPELVRRVAEGEHIIGNHSWNHPSFPLIASRERREQVRACERTIAPYGQRLFRPPYGHQNLASRFDVLRLGYEVVTWNVVAEDWCDRKPDWMAERLVKHIKPGSVVLLHDAIYRSVQILPQYDRKPMLEALEITLQRLAGRFRFVTVPELLRHGVPQRQNWYMGAGIDALARLKEHPLIVRESASRD